MRSLLLQDRLPWKGRILAGSGSMMADLVFESFSKDALQKKSVITAEAAAALVPLLEMQFLHCDTLFEEVVTLVLFL